MDQKLREIIQGLYGALIWLKSEAVTVEHETYITAIRSAITYLSLLPCDFIKESEPLIIEKDDDETQELTPSNEESIGE